MISWLNKQLKNILEFQIADKLHNEWIKEINKYYKNACSDPEKTEKYLNNLLNTGDISSGTVKIKSQNKIISDSLDNMNEENNFISKYNLSDENEKSETNILSSLKKILIECLKGMEKYGSILIHRKF